jgi:hypothetical protein
MEKPVLRQAAKLTKTLKEIGKGVFRRGSAERFASAFSSSRKPSIENVCGADAGHS